MSADLTERINAALAAPVAKCRDVLPLLREAAEQLAATDALVAELRAEVPHMERWEHDDCLLCGESWPCAGWAAS